jgi:hypothetical protein
MHNFIKKQRAGHWISVSDVEPKPSQELEPEPKLSYVTALAPAKSFGLLSCGSGSTTLINRVERAELRLECRLRVTLYRYVLLTTACAIMHSMFVSK